MAAHSKQSRLDRFSPLVRDEPGFSKRPRFVRRADLLVGDRFRVWRKWRAGAVTVTKVEPEFVTVITHRGLPGFLSLTN